MKILLVCHAFAPGRGSEPGFGWNWAWYLSRDHEIWALAHPEYRAEVDAYLAVHPNPQLHVVWLSATAWDPAKGMGGFHWHYVRWVKQAQQLGRSLHSEVAFDLVHHISLSTISAPPAWWKLGIPFVWGPLGGAQVCPPQLRELFEGQQWREWVRLVRLRLLRYYPPFRAAVRRSATVLATNRETRQFLESVGIRNVPLFWDSGILDEALPPAPTERAQPATLRILWAGGFQKRKALPLALEALNALEAMRLSRGAVPMSLVVAGDGDERDNWMARAASLGVAHCVEFLGKLTPGQMRDEFRRADVFLFTSVRDSCANVVLEAMSQGLPVVTLDLHGVGDYMPDNAGIKVAVGSRASIARDLAAALDRLARDPALRYAMGTEAWRFAATQLWSKRAAQMNSLYGRVTLASTREAVAEQAQPDTVGQR